MLNWLTGHWPQLIGSGVALTGAYVALVGLNTWKTQLRGRTEYELARRTLRAVLEVRDQIAGVRHPFISPGERSEALKEAGSGANDGHVTEDEQGDQLVYDRRFRKLSNALSDLRVELLEAEVLWGKGIRVPEGKLRDCIGKLYAAVHHHLMRKSGAISGDSLPDKMREGFLNTLYLVSRDPSEDEFATKVEDAVAEFEELLRPHLRLGR